MSGRYLLDTNIIIATFAKDKEVIERIDKSIIVFVCNIVLGELYYGAFKSKHMEKNLACINEFIGRSAVINSDIATAQYYGQIKNKLKAKGRPIPENDIWIAAIARQHGLTLVSRDSHFREVEGLDLEIW